MTCLRCGAQTNGVTLCTRCTTTLDVALEALPDYHAGLFSIGNTPPPIRGRRRGEPVDPTGNAINRRDTDTAVETAAAETTTMLNAWARTLIADRPKLKPPTHNVKAMAGFLRTNLPTIATLPWADDLTRQVLTFERRLKGLATRGQGSWYAGVCYAPLGEAIDDFCPRDLYAHPGETYIRCTGCGAHWSVDDRRNLLIQAGRDRLLPVAVIARVAVALIEGEPSQERLESRLRTWVQRGQLDDYGVRVLIVGQQPRRVYRLGDVLDRLTAELERDRAKKAVATSGSTA